MATKRSRGRSGTVWSETEYAARGLVKVGARVRVELRDRLYAAAEARGVTVAAMLTDALERYLDGM